MSIASLQTPPLFLLDPGQARGCSTNTVVINKLIYLAILVHNLFYNAPLPKRFELYTLFVEIMLSIKRTYRK